MAKITNTDQIVDIQFTEVENGFDPDQVNSALDDICDFIDEKDSMIAELQQQLAVAQAKLNSMPAQAPAAPAARNDGSQDALELIAMAQQFKAQVIAKAEADAREILSQAQADADAQLKGLADERDRLNNEIGMLKSSLAEYRSKFESLLKQI